jgi:hypothetical protein
MQQLSGSVGFGGTLIPATSFEAASISIRRSLTPGFEPKTVRARSSVISFCDFGVSVVDGGAGADGAVSFDVEVCDGAFLSISTMLLVTRT